MSATSGKVALVPTRRRSRREPVRLSLLKTWSATGLPCFRGHGGPNADQHHRRSAPRGGPTPTTTPWTSRPGRRLLRTPGRRLSINDVSRRRATPARRRSPSPSSLSAPAGAGRRHVRHRHRRRHGARPETATTCAQSLTGQIDRRGQSAYPFDVTVNGDTAVEADETFLVNVTNVIGADRRRRPGPGHDRERRLEPVRRPVHADLRDPGQRRERCDHRQRHDRGRRRRRLRGDGREPAASTSRIRPATATRPPPTASSSSRAPRTP